MGISRDELARHLSEQVYFLESAARGFDQGHVQEGKRIAVALRVLLHDTATSHSLLGQMRDLATTRFPCVSEQAAPDNAIFATGAMYSMSLGGPTGSGLVAKTVMSARTEPFPTWWTETCTKSQAVKITRRSAVLALANQGGGAHIDPRERSEYRHIVELKALGWIYSDDNNPDGTPETPLNNPLPYIARATAAEVLALLGADGLAQ